MYQALYGPKGSVIFDHPYNADSARRTGMSIIAVSVRRLSSSACATLMGQCVILVLRLVDPRDGAGPVAGFALW